MSWLLQSMLLEISQRYLFLYTTKEVWDAATQTLKMGNATQIYELKQRIHGTTQDERSVTTYFHKLRGL
jgi:hypothetical protein